MFVEAVVLANETNKVCFEIDFLTNQKVLPGILMSSKVSNDPKVSSV